MRARRKSNPAAALVGPPNLQRFKTTWDLSRDERKSVYRQWRCGNGTVTALAQRYGLERADIEEIINAHVTAEIEAARVDGFKAGKRSVLHFPPATAVVEMRRAA